MTGSRRLAIAGIVGALAGLALISGPLGVASAQTNEYELVLPSASGGSVDPSERAGEKPRASDDEANEPAGAAPTAPVAPTEPEVVPAEGGDSSAEGRRDGDRSLDARRYPRGSTYELGPAEDQVALPASSVAGDGDGGGPGLALAVLAAAGGLLAVLAAWRVRAGSSGGED